MKSFKYNSEEPKKSSYTFKKKVDPFAYFPSIEDRTNSDEARIFLEEISREHSILFDRSSIELSHLEKIFEGRCSSDAHLIIIGIFLKRRGLLKDTRKYKE